MTREVFSEEVAKVLKIAHDEQRFITSDKSIKAIAEILTTFYDVNYMPTEGEWLRQKGDPEAVCSNCGREAVYQIIDDRWRFENFCPHCGARMKEDVK